MSGFLLALAAALVFHGILFVICTVLSSIFHLGAVEKCSLIYTNAGNIIMPLVAALLGEEWQIYATAFLAVQMTILFSHGPVSYTHLDVYKRQGSWCDQRGEAFSGFCGSDHIQAAYKIEAIIYTSVCLCGSVLVVGDQHVFYASTAVSAGFL